jgi:transposase-like protein
MDETSRKGNGPWDDLYRAVEKTGQTMDCLRTAPRAAHAAQRCLTQAMRRHGVPEKSTIDGSAAKEAAITSSQTAHGTAIAIRQTKSLNPMVAPDHRGVQRITRPLFGGKAFDAAQATCVGIALLHMIKTRPLGVEEGNEGLTAAAWFYSLAASSPPPIGATAPS